MISILTNRVEIKADFAKHIEQFTGNRMTVLIALALKANLCGETIISQRKLAALTGLNKLTVIRTLKSLEEIEIDTLPVIISEQRYQQGRFGYKTYILFPTAAQVEAYKRSKKS
jgi:hypothetical protein